MPGLCQRILLMLSHTLLGMGAGCTVTLILGGTVVLVGNMLKFQAQYVPKLLVPRYLNEDVVAGGPIATTYWDLLKRVNRLEGVPGLLRGIVPMFLQSVLFLCSALLMSKFGFSLPAKSISVSLLSILACPVGVLMTRTLTTHELLPYFDIHRALHTLLTPEERARPWLLYLIPGILPITVIHTVWHQLIIPRLRKAITPLVVDQYRTNILALIQFGFLLLDIAVFLPLETLAMRFALTDVGSMMTSTTEERVLSLRTGKPPYIGLWHCVVSIIDEEGLGALYRAWWLMLLARLPKVAKEARNAAVSSRTTVTEKNQEIV